jgi:hypothetical protein
MVNLRDTFLGKIKLAEQGKGVKRKISQIHNLGKSFPHSPNVLNFPELFLDVFS